MKRILFLILLLNTLVNAQIIDPFTFSNGNLTVQDAKWKGATNDSLFKIQTNQVIITSTTAWLECGAYYDSALTTAFNLAIVTPTIAGSNLTLSMITQPALGYGNAGVGYEMYVISQGGIDTVVFRRNNAYANYVRYGTITREKLANDTLGIKLSNDSLTFFIRNGVNSIAYTYVDTTYKNNAKYFKLYTTNGAGTSYAFDNFMNPTGSGSVIYPPTVTTDTAIVVGYDSAKVIGSVNPNGGATEGWFSYGLGGMFEPDTAGTKSAGAGSVAVKDTVTLTGLTQGKTYYYNKIALNSGGVSSGTLRTFTTLSNRDLVAPTIALSHSPTAIDSSLLFQITLSSTDVYGIDSLRIVVKNSAGATYDSVIQHYTAPTLIAVLQTTSKKYAVGNYTYYARTRDDSGNVANSSTYSFTVNPVYYSGSSFAVIGYYPFHAAPAYPPTILDYSSVTHLIHFGTAASPTSPYFLPVVSASESLSVEFSNQYYGNTNTPVQRILIDSAHAHGVKVLLGIAAVSFYGGDVGSMRAMMSDSAMTQTFVNSVIAYITRKGYDGIDMNWEFPSTSDRVGFTRYMRILRRGLDTMTPHGVLTYAAYFFFDTRSPIGGYQDMPLLNQYVDFAMPEIYGLNMGQMNSNFGHTGALHKPTTTGYDAGTLSDTATYQGAGKMFAYGAWKAGLDKSKIAPGFWTVYHYTSSGNLNFGQSNAGVSIFSNSVFNIGLADPQNPTYGTTALPAAAEQWDDEAKMPYKRWTESGVTHIMSYDNARSLSEKISWLKANGYGGMMLYDIGSFYINTNPAWGGITNYTGDRQALLKAVGLYAKQGTEVIPDTVKIMFDGDSQTNLDWQGGYRRRVKDLLVGGGYKTNFVGPFNYGQADWTTPDYEHNGLTSSTVVHHIDGWTSYALPKIRTVLTTYDPDIMTIQLGANDLNANTYTVAQYSANMRRYLDTIWTVSPSLKVILQTIGFPDSTIGSWNTNLPKSRIRQANDSLKTIITHYQGLGKYILLCDINVALTNPVAQVVWGDAGDLVGDGIHCSGTGYQKWANALYPKLTEAISNVTIPTETAPSAPTLITPVNGATSQGVTPTLLWHKPTGATTYNYYINTDSTFQVESTLIGGAGTDTFVTLTTPLTGSTTYYWRVTASNAVGTTSTYSSMYHFTTALTAPPGVPVLISPVDSATGVLTTASLVWGAVPYATLYNIQIDTSQNMQDKTILLNDVVYAPTTSYQPSILEAGKTYYWRVRCQTLTGWGAFSDTNSFTTLAIPSAPTIVYPANAQIDLPLSFNYRWNTVSTATGYTFQVSTSSTFANITGGALVNDTTLSVANSTAIMSENTTYYWRVSARNTSGASGWSNYSASPLVYNSFTTQTTAVVPSIPTLVTPANSSTNQDLAITFKWNKISDATTYTFQLSSDNFADTIQTDVITAPDTTLSIGDLDYSTTYYWRVKATNTVGSSAYASRTFTTKSTPVAVPTAPVLSSPLDEAENQDTSIVFVWGAVSGATSYQIQVSTSATYATTILNQSGITAVKDTLSGLSDGTHYYWRVRATNTAGSSTWSSRSFYTSPITLDLDYIYSDSLETGWTNNSFRTQIEFNSDTSWTGYGIKAFSQKQGIVRFQHNSLATTTYDSLIIYIKPKKIGMFKIYFKGTLGFPVTNKTLTINVWNRITIPIATLNPRDQSVTNICIQNVRPDALVYYIDEVYFK